jgi:hypothetical protein
MCPIPEDQLFHKPCERLNASGASEITSTFYRFCIPPFSRKDLFLRSSPSINKLSCFHDMRGKDEQQLDVFSYGLWA